MRLFRLGRIIVSAEALRLRYHARRTATRIVLLGFACVLILSALVFGHIAVWFWLRESFSRVVVALIFTGADLLVAIVLAVVGTRSGPGRIEREARAVRERAWDNALSSMTVSAVLMQVAQLFMVARSRK